MARTRGARDLKKRKKRKGIKHKYKKRISKRTGEPYLIPYESKRINREVITISLWLKKPMTKQGLMNWNKYLRPTIRPFIYKIHHIVERVNVSDLENEDRVVNTVMNLAQHQGEFLVMGITNAKTKTHRKWVKLCRIEIIETPDSVTGRFLNNYRLYRYWFWHRRRKK